MVSEVGEVPRWVSEIQVAQTKWHQRTNGRVNAHLRSAVYTNVIENSPSLGADEALGPFFFFRIINILGMSIGVRLKVRTFGNKHPDGSNVRILFLNQIILLHEHKCSLERTFIIKSY